MGGEALQGVPPAVLAQLHGDAMRLGARIRATFPGDWRDTLAPHARARATIAALHASTQLMEAMSWLLRAQAGSLGTATWHAGASTPVPALGTERAGIATAIDRLYADIIAADAAARQQDPA